MPWLRQFFATSNTTCDDLLVYRLSDCSPVSVGERHAPGSGRSRFRASTSCRSMSRCWSRRARWVSPWSASPTRRSAKAGSEYERHSRARAGAAAAAYHRQSLACRSRQGVQPLRSADRRRPARSPGVIARGVSRTMSCWASWPRRHADARAGRAAAAIAARAAGRGVICPAVCGGEAAWGGFDTANDAGADPTALASPPQLSPRRRCSP